MGGENGEGLRAHLGNIMDRINVPASLAATGLSVVAMNAAIYIPNWGEDTLPGKLKDAGTIEKTNTNEVVVGRSTRMFHKHTVDRRPVDSVSGTSEFQLKSGAQVYAEEFSADPSAGEFSDPKSLDNLVDGIRNLVENDAEITTITITGYSSAEDDNPDGGFTEPSAKNTELAQKRADTVAHDLTQRLAEDPELDKATKDIQIKFRKPVEQELTSKQQERLDNIATTSGFASAKDMVQTWNNDPGSVSDSDRKFLDDLLGAHRKVSADIGWRRQGKDIYEVDDYCTRFIVTNLKTEEEKHKEHIPVIPYFMPILIPRRRKKGSTPSPYRQEFSPRLADAAEGRISREEYLGERVETTGRPSGWRRLLRLGDRVPKPRKTTDSRGDTRGEKILRRALLGTMVGAFGLLACINISGKDCDGDIHVPRPFLIDAFWDSIDGNPDMAQQYSLGVPFVDSLQLFRSDWQVPTFTLSGNPYDVCHDGGSSTSVGPNTGPKCSTVRIVKKDGKVISSKVVYNAGPYKTHTAIEKTK